MARSDDAMAVTPQLVDLVLVFVAIEAAGLVLFLQATGRGRLAPPAALFLASGAALMTAVRCALAGADALVAPSMLAAFALHAGTIWAVGRLFRVDARVR